MKMAICRCGEGGTVSVQGIERSRMMSAGSRVDLDEVLVPATADRQAQTLKQALGHYLSLFEIEPEPLPARLTGRRGLQEPAANLSEGA